MASRHRSRQHRLLDRRPGRGADCRSAACSGSTFNFVFENQLEKLQDGDRFYYLERTGGPQLRQRAGDQLVRQADHGEHRRHAPARRSCSRRRPSRSRSTRRSSSPVSGADGRADPDRRHHDRRPSRSRRWSSATIPTPPARTPTICTTPATDHVVLGGTAGNDIIIASDRRRHALGRRRQRPPRRRLRQRLHPRRRRRRHHHRHRAATTTSRAATATTSSRAAAASTSSSAASATTSSSPARTTRRSVRRPGNDFILGNKSNEQDIGNEGDDWIEKGTSDGAPGDNFDPLRQRPDPRQRHLHRRRRERQVHRRGRRRHHGRQHRPDRPLRSAAPASTGPTYKDDKIGVTIDIERPLLRPAAGAGFGRVGARPLRHRGGSVGLVARRLSCAATTRSTSIGGEVGGAPRAARSPTSRSSTACRSSSTTGIRHPASPASRPATSSSAATAATS